MFATTLLELDGSKFRAEKDSIKSVYVPKSIADFLSKTSSSTVLVGQKGTGKSILLSYKKFNDTGNSGDATNHFFPKSNGVEEINLDGELGIKSLLPLSIEDWEKIFIIAIQYYLFCQLRDVILVSKFLPSEDYDKQEVHKYLNPQNLDVKLLQFGNILHEAIEQKVCYKDLSSFRSVARNVIIGGVVEYNKSNIFYYLDGLDQAIYKAIFKSVMDEYDEEKEITNILYFEERIFDRKEEKQNKHGNKVHLWIKAQLGFLKALHHLNELNQNAFKIYGSIRNEAYVMLERYNLKNLPQLKSTCKVIKYSKEEMVEVFEKLLFVAGIDKQEFKKYGIDELIHNKVNNKSYDKESIQNHILRHTLGNPREITYQVVAIKHLFESNTLIPSESIDNTGRLKAALSLTINEIRNDFRSETLPGFPGKGLQNLLEEFQKNYIPNEKVTEEYKNIVTILYRLGLIGVLKQETNNSFIQYFLEKNIYFLNSNEKLPDSPFYLLHPVLDPMLFDNYGHDAFYYPHCIIGHGLPFIFLREESYYIPANLLNKVLSGDLLKAKNIFCEYYKSNEAMGMYNNTFERFYSAWASTILSFYLLQKGDLDSIKKSLFNKLDNHDRVFLTIDNSKREDNIALRRTYKLRMIVGLLQACNLLLKKDLENLYVERYKFKERSFFSNIRKADLSFDKLSKFWSSYEIDCLRKSLYIFNSKNSNEIDAFKDARVKFTKLEMIFPEYK